MKFLCSLLNKVSLASKTYCVLSLYPQRGRAMLSILNPKIPSHKVPISAQAYQKAVIGRNQEAALRELGKIDMAAWSLSDKLWGLGMTLSSPINFCSSKLIQGEMLFVALNFVEKCHWDIGDSHIVLNMPPKDWSEFPLHEEIKLVFSNFGKVTASHLEDFHTISINNQKSICRAIRFFAQLNLPWHLLGGWVSSHNAPPPFEVISKLFPDLKTSIAQTHPGYAQWLNQIDRIEKFQCSSQLDQNFHSNSSQLPFSLDKGSFGSEEKELELHGQIVL